MIALAAALAVLLATDPAVPPQPDLEALWSDAILWEVGSNAQKVPAARRALIAEGERALDFIVPSRLDTKDGLAIRALQVVVPGIGAAAVPRLVPLLESERPDVRRNAADLLGLLGARDAAPAIARLLADPDARLGALAALSALGARETVPQVTALAGNASAPERARVAATVALGALGGDEAVGALVARLSDQSAQVRFAAQGSLEKLAAVGALLPLASSAESRVRLHAIAALGRIGDASSRARLLAALSDASPVVRGFAAEALVSVALPEDLAAAQAKRRAELDPFARGKLDALVSKLRPE